MINYEQLWNDHKAWLKSGFNYYLDLLDDFETKDGDVYARVSAIASLFQSHLDKMEKEEGVE